MRAAFDRRNGWRKWHLFGAIGGAAIAGVIASNAWRDLLHIARREEESSHIWLVPLVFIWLIWVRKSRLRTAVPGGAWPGTIMIAAGWFLWSFGYRDQFQSFWHGGAVIMCLGAILVVVGRDLLYKFLPAILVLAFLIPVPKTARIAIAQPLQEITASVTRSVAEVLGMEVQQRGSLITFNGTEVAIAEACNGMRMVFTLFLACYVFAFVTPLRGYVRAIILLASPVTAIVCNVIRLVPTVWVFGHATRDRAEMFHDISGWVMLIVAFLGLTGIVRLLRWAMVPVSPFTLAAA
ncbi:MAG TPA: exosortase/archaeosortase family protein [Tepidisphaeraceae bacterium]|jgi:exosortase